MVNENDRPPVAPQEEFDDQPPMMGGVGRSKMPTMGGGNNLVKTALIALVVTLVVVLVVNMTGAMWVSKTDFTTNLSNMSATITQMQTADKAANDKVNAMSSTISSTVSEAVSKATSGVSTQLGTLTTTVNGFSQKINDASSQASAATNQINSMNGQIASLKADNESLKSQVAALKSGGSSTDLTALSNRVKALETTVATLQSSGGAVTTTGGGSSGSGTSSSTNGQVTASVVSYSYANIFNGNTNAPAALTFTPQQIGSLASLPTQPSTNATLASIAGSTGGNLIWLNNITSQNFQIQIQNGTGKTLSNIQLALTFVWIKSDGTQVTLPYASSYAISSMGNPQWTSTSYDQTYASWSTGTNNTILGSVFPFTQSPGTNSYYSTLSVTFPTVSSNSTATPPIALQTATWYAIPIIKVVGYSTQ